MRFRYSSGRPQEAWRMLERAITEMVTVPSKVADTREPLRAIMMPVVLNISRPGRLGDRGGRNQHSKTWQ